MEDYLEVHLSLPGQDLLIIGRQVKTAGGIIDLLAIDSTGVIHIIELKLRGADPTVIGQIVVYRYSVKQLNREEIIRLVADGALKIDLLESFQRHFGHPLPETVNESQVLVVIAASIQPQTRDGIRELREGGYPVPVTTFEYIRGLDAVSVIPRRNDQDVEEDPHAETEPPAPPNRISPLPRPSVNYPVNENVRRFWSAHAQDFAPFATFEFIFKRYDDWIDAQPPIGVHVRNMGLVSRHVGAIAAESDEWTRVWVAPRSDMAAYNTIMAPPDARTYRGDHTVVAFQRNPIGRAQQL